MQRKKVKHSKAKERQKSERPRDDQTLGGTAVQCSPRLTDTKFQAHRYNKQPQKKKTTVRKPQPIPSSARMREPSSGPCYTCCVRGERSNVRCAAELQLLGRRNYRCRTRNATKKNYRTETNTRGARGNIEKRTAEKSPAGPRSKGSGGSEIRKCFRSTFG